VRRERLDRREVERDTDPRGDAGAAAYVPTHHGDGQAVREQQVVDDARVEVGPREPRRVRAGDVPEVGHDPRLVVCDPVAHTVAQAVGDGIGVLHEALHGVAVSPAAALLQRLGQVPVVKRDEGPDIVLEQQVDQALVEVEAGPIRAQTAASFRLDTRPRDGEAIGLQAKFAHQRHVLAHAMVVVVGGLARAAVDDLAGDGGEAVPDTLATPTLARGPLNLVGRGRHAP